MTTNVMGNLHLLEQLQKYSIKKYVLTSISSLYTKQKLPFVETLPVNAPVLPYAAS